MLVYLVRREAVITKYLICYEYNDLFIIIIMHILGITWYEMYHEDEYLSDAITNDVEM